MCAFVRLDQRLYRYLCVSYRSVYVYTRAHVMIVCVCVCVCVRACMREWERENGKERFRERMRGGESERAMRGGVLGSSTIFKNLMSPTPRRKWYLTTGRRAH